MTDRQPYTAPAQPVVVGAVEASKVEGYGGEGSDGANFYSSVPTPV